MIQKLLNAEPTAIRALITAILTFAVSAGLMTQAHADTATSIAGAVLPVLLILINGILTRNAVYSPKTTQAIANRAAATGNTDIGSPPSGDTAAPVLTSADAAADLAGTPRPDNPTVPPTP